MKLAISNPFKAPFEKWCRVYAMAIGVFLITTFGALVIGYGLCTKPLSLDFICKAELTREIVEAIVEFVGDALPYVVKIGVLAFVVRTVTAAWERIFVKKATSASSGRVATKGKKK
jgi:hypothetical protein